MCFFASHIDLLVLYLYLYRYSKYIHFLNVLFTTQFKYSIFWCQWKCSPPQLKDESAEGFDLFISQFNRYLRVSKIDSDQQLDLLLLCVGDKSAGYYDEINWAPLSTAQKTKGITDYSRATDFFTLQVLGRQEYSMWAHSSLHIEAGQRTINQWLC